MRNNINWDCLKNDIPFGKTAGILAGKLVGGVAYGIRHPILGTSQLAGTAEGFFAGLKLGLEVTAANFEKAKIRGTVNKLTREEVRVDQQDTENLKSLFKLDSKKKSLVEKLRGLPESIRNEILGEAQLTPGPA